MAQAEVINILEWVERLGGWGVLLLVVHWMMRRLDRQGERTDRLVDGMERSVEAFSRFEGEGRRLHGELDMKMDVMQEGIDQLRDLADPRRSEDSERIERPERIGNPERIERPERKEGE